MILKKQAEIITEYYEEYVKYYKKYIEGRETIYAIERLAQLLIQSILDYAALLASSEKGVKPPTYKGLARYLGEHLSLGKEYIVFLEKLAGFRNILVHGYARINRKLEDEAFKEIYERIPVVLNAIQEYSDKDPCYEDVAKALKRVGKRLGFIRYIILYGSIARNGCGRDIDIAVKGDFKSALDLGRIVSEIEGELGVPADLIDIVDLDNAPPHLVKRILDEGVLVYGDPSTAYPDLARLYSMVLDWFEWEKLLKYKTGREGRTLEYSASKS
ncbi:MAG: HepT-like ribonuclease domain-containing protein [Thermoprotei archaeon]